MAKKSLNFLPRKLTKLEIASAPSDWTRVLSRYSIYRLKALWCEDKPGYFTLLTAAIAAVAKKDRHLFDVAAELTKGNMPQDIYFSLLGLALSAFGKKEESLKMAREALKVNRSPGNLVRLAVETDDLDEKEDLAKEVLNEKSIDIKDLKEAQRLLADAKYFKGEHDEGERLYDEILTRDPGDRLVLESKGDIYFFHKNDYSKALELYSKIKLKPTPLSILFNISYCYLALDKVKKARKIAKKIPATFVSDWGRTIKDLNRDIDEALGS